MKKIEFIIVGLFLSLLIVSPINAAYVDLTIDGISLSNDGDVYYPSSGEVTIDVWIVGEGETLSNYSFDILYDMSEGISFLSGEEIEPSGWVSFSTFENSTPYVQGIEALNFMSSDIVLDDRVQVAALTFTYDLQLLVDDGLPDFEAFYRSGQAMTFVEDGLPVTYQPESIGADLAAVPVPAAVWLLGSGLLGLVGLRRHDR